MNQTPERDRHSLYARLQEVLGVDAANTLMAHLPPTGWADVATQHGVDSAITLLRSELRREIADLRSEVGERHNSLLRWMFVTVLTSNATMAGVIIAALS